jgi:hypothetical protein
MLFEVDDLFTTNLDHLSPSTSSSNSPLTNFTLDPLLRDPYMGGEAQQQQPKDLTQPQQDTAQHPLEEKWVSQQSTANFVDLSSQDASVNHTSRVNQAKRSASDAQRQREYRKRQKNHKSQMKTQINALIKKNALLENENKELQARSNSNGLVNLPSDTSLSAMDHHTQLDLAQTLVHVLVKVLFLFLRGLLSLVKSNSYSPAPTLPTHMPRQQAALHPTSRSLRNSDLPDLV